MFLKPSSPDCHGAPSFAPVAPLFQSPVGKGASSLPDPPSLPQDRAVRPPHQPTCLPPLLTVRLSGRPRWLLMSSVTRTQDGGSPRGTHEGTLAGLGCGLCPAAGVGTPAPLGCGCVLWLVWGPGSAVLSSLSHTLVAPVAAGVGDNADTLPSVG